jgi:carbon-monoxide dehydrogenase small subunit
MTAHPVPSVEVTIVVNGEPHRLTVDVRDTLADVLRDRLDLTGTNLGCEHGVCGTCTVLVDGRAMRSCLLLAAQCDGRRIGTVEGLAARRPTAEGPDGERWHPLQEAFHREHGLQCGFCTPGFLMLLAGALTENPDLDRDPEALETVLSSVLCRCTGYVNIRAAAIRAARELRALDRTDRP